MALPSHIKARQAPDAGAGLFTSKQIPAGEEVFRIDRPLAAALDSPRLTQVCYECFLWPQENGKEARMGLEGAPAVKDRTLKDCLGCKVVKYCCKDCQSRSWKSGHKYECKIYAKLYPKVLPNTVRLVTNLLLRKTNGALTDSEWTHLLGLQSHLEGFKTQNTKNNDGLTTWQTIELMSKAISSYSHSKEPIRNIQAVVARTLINTHTLTTPALDPLGLCLSPLTAQLNHSCTPNTHIIFCGRSLRLRSLGPLPPDAELTISYIDTTNSTSTRQHEFQTRYFFTCRCPFCIQTLTNGFHDPAPNTTFSSLSSRAQQLQAEACASTSWSQGAPLLDEALTILEPYPPDRQPYAAILHTAVINAIGRRDWQVALSRALFAHFRIEPVQYPLNWHPVRVVRNLVLLRLILQYLDAAAVPGSEEHRHMGGWAVEWPIIVMALWRAVSEGSAKSHGVDTDLTEELRVMGEGMIRASGYTGALTFEQVGSMLATELGRVDKSEIEMQWRRLETCAENKYKMLSLPPYGEHVQDMAGRISGQ